MMHTRRTTLAAGLTALGTLTAMTVAVAGTATAHNDNPAL